MNRFDLYRQMRADARDRFFKTHEIYAEGDGRWTLRCKNADGHWQSNDWAEIVEIYQRTGLFVGGDFEASAFSGYSGEQPVIRWVGRHGDDMEYLAKKSERALGPARVEYNTRVAAEDLLEYELQLQRDTIEEAIDVYSDGVRFVLENPEEESPCEALVQWLFAFWNGWQEYAKQDADDDDMHDAIDQVGLGDVEGAIRTLLASETHGGDGEAFYRLGRVIPQRIFVAQAAVERLCTLLDARAQIASTQVA